MTGDAAPSRPVAWVTGAAAGWVRTPRCNFPRAGYDVAVTARDQARLEAVANEIAAVGGRALACASDLTDRRSTAAFADAALASFGRCDVLCNIGIYNGPGVTRLLMESDLDDLRDQLRSRRRRAGPALPACDPLDGRARRRHDRQRELRRRCSSIHQETRTTTGGASCTWPRRPASTSSRASSTWSTSAQGIRAFNAEPGFVAYGEAFDRMLRQYPGVPVSHPPEAIGPAIVWLVREEAASRFLSNRVNLPALTLKNDLLPGWNGPGTNFASGRS